METSSREVLQENPRKSHGREGGGERKVDSPFSFLPADPFDQRKARCKLGGFELAFLKDRRRRGGVPSGASQGDPPPRPICGRALDDSNLFGFVVCAQRMSRSLSEEQAVAFW